MFNIQNHKPFISGIILGTLFGFILFRRWQDLELERMHKGENNGRRKD